LECLSLKREWLNDGERNHHDEESEGWMKFVIDSRSGRGGDISRVVQQIDLGGVMETAKHLRGQALILDIQGIL
jgi:hypothetical protein